MARKSAASISEMIRNIRHTLAVTRHVNRTPKVHVGTDINGNRYFKQAGSDVIGVKERRWIDSANADSSFVPRVPIEWDSWLRGRRSDPPTEQEAAAVAQRLEVGRRMAEREAEKTSDTGFTDPTKKVPFPRYGDMKVNSFGRHETE